MHMRRWSWIPRTRTTRTIKRPQPNLVLVLVLDNRIYQLDSKTTEDGYDRHRSPPQDHR
jgi:hypothetical protein